METCIRNNNNNEYMGDYQMTAKKPVTRKKETEKAKKKMHGLSTREIVELLLTEMETALKKDPDDDF